MTINLTEKQQSAVNVLADSLSGTLIGYAGTGKAQPVHAQVQTPNGPKAIGCLKVGDAVFGSNGQPTHVTGVFPQGRKMTYRITFRDGVTVECCDEHLWAVATAKTRRSDGWKVMSLNDILKAGVTRPSGDMRFSIPLCAPVCYPAKALAIDPYVLGVLIGDGYLTGSSPAFSTPDMDSDIVARVEGRLPVRHYVKGNRTPACPQYRIVSSDQGEGSNTVTVALRALELNVGSTTRFIPEMYLQGSVDQRLDLLRGLMDTDGSSTGNRISYSTLSERLACDVQTLVQSLGGTSIVRKYDRGEKGMEYCVNVKMTVNPFYSERKKAGWRPSRKNPPSRYIRSVETVGEHEHVCISVAAVDSLYLTDSFIVTHNTTAQGELCRKLRERGRLPILTAPTHKASRVLANKTGLPVQTIHSTLKLVPRPNYKDGGRTLSQVGDPDLPPNGVLIVDEASMLSPRLMDIILDQPLPCILVGDAAQLPPVGYRDPVFLDYDVAPKIELTEILRQKGDNPLPTIAYGWRKGAGRPSWPTTDAMGTEGGVLVRNRSRAVEAFLSGVEAHHKSGAQSTEVSPFLCYTNKAADAAGMEARLRLFGNKVYTDPYVQGEMLVCNNPVIMENDIVLHVSSVVRVMTEPTFHPVPYGGEDWPAYHMVIEEETIGQTFEVLAMPFNARSALLNDVKEEAVNVTKRYGFGAELTVAAWTKYHTFENELLDLRTVYASTIHKSQGSTYPDVFIDRNDLTNRNADDIRCQLVYTALTRASSTATIAG